MSEILNKQVKFLTTQYIGTFAIVPIHLYKGLCPKLNTNTKKQILAKVPI